MLVRISLGVHEKDDAGVPDRRHPQDRKRPDKSGSHFRDMCRRMKTEVVRTAHQGELQGDDVGFDRRLRERKAMAAEHQPQTVDHVGAAGREDPRIGDERIRRNVVPRAQRMVLVRDDAVLVGKQRPPRQHRLEALRLRHGGQHEVEFPRLEELLQLVVRTADHPDPHAGTLGPEPPDRVRQNRVLP
jgi:hypothetical protein